MHGPSPSVTGLRLARGGSALVASGLVALVAAASAHAAGPPFPDPVTNQAVYDTANVLRPASIAAAEARIDEIEARTGAEVVVYTQVVDGSITTSEAEAHAVALIDQWGIGRAGFDDGMVILFDLDPSLCHGQVQLYAAPGFAATYLTNGERQAIFDNDMLPHLRRCDLDAALDVAIERIAAAATPEHAAVLQVARQLNAVVGLIAAPAVLLGIAGITAVTWRRHGRDPVYLDSPSIHLPAPPPDLTAASGAVLLQGRAKRRALTTALLDLASRGQLSFREETGLLGLNRKVGIETNPPAEDEITEARRARNARRPIGPAEQLAHARLRTLAGSEDGYLGPEEILTFGPYVDNFEEKLEDHVVDQGWFRERPGKVIGRWAVRAGAAFIGGIIVVVAGAGLPASGLVLLGIALAAGGVIMALVAPSMPSVTREGAVLRAQLAAYRRTLEKTMAQARTMRQVVDEAGLPWLDTPDRAIVWGVALGLEDEIEQVLDRTTQDIARGFAEDDDMPRWYRRAGSDESGRGGGDRGGLFSSSPMPRFSGMFAALGTIGNAPSSSDGGGGFGGGSSGGGGGGAGGGF